MDCEKEVMLASIWWSVASTAAEGTRAPSPTDSLQTLWFEVAQHFSKPN